MPPARLLGATVTLALALSAGAEEPAAPASLDDTLEPIRKQHALPALAAAIVTVDGLHSIGAVGARRAGGEEAVTPGDLWHLGSCTKAMTATLIARLVEKGTLTWTTTLGEVFPKQAAMDAAWKPVTLEQLLANRGGAPAALDRAGLWASLWAHQGTPTEGRRKLFAGVVRFPPEYEPGTKMLYANANFAIAGHVAEAVVGEAWEDLLRREVFTPLGITSAGFGAPGTPGKAATQPRGHGPDGKPKEPGPTADNPQAIGPAGTVHMTLRDWGRFVAAHLRGARGDRVAGTDGNVFLAAESWTKLHTPPGDGYALGWSVGTRPGWARGPNAGDTGRILTHNGSNTLWYCVTWLAPEKGYAVLVATNSGVATAAKATDDAAAALIGLMRKR